MISAPVKTWEKTQLYFASSFNKWHNKNQLPKVGEKVNDIWRE